MVKQYAKYEASPGSPPGKPRNGNNAKPAASAAKGRPRLTCAARLGEDNG
jgi:hypothetical protein